MLTCENSPGFRARAANDTTRAQINNIPEKSQVIMIPLLIRESLQSINQSTLFKCRKTA